MVYARMEHLQIISKFILGDALPADPAGPHAVAGQSTKSTPLSVLLKDKDTRMYGLACLAIALAHLAAW